MTPRRPRYLAYMLRLWQAGGDEAQGWRASLESPHTGERHGFADLGQLIVFLEEQTDTPLTSQAGSGGVRSEAEDGG